jgi:dihydrofolate reductase
MGKVVLEITMSLDGFVAAPNVDIARPLGEGGMCLHNWLFGDGTLSATRVDREAADEIFASAGAFIIGRRMFDVGEGPWGEDGAFGKPCYVLTHRGKDKMIKGPTTFNFVTDGIDSALEQAKAVAGDKNITVMGGANIAQQYLKAGLVDEMRIHVAPVLLGAGTRLFENINTQQIKLEITRVMESPLATHIIYSIARKQ